MSTETIKIYRATHEGETQYYITANDAPEGWTVEEIEVALDSAEFQEAFNRLPPEVRDQTDETATIIKYTEYKYVDSDYSQRRPVLSYWLTNAEIPCNYNDGLTKYPFVFEEITVATTSDEYKEAVANQRS
jgi:hypothetical protein